jgi:hypothetical protein
MITELTHDEYCRFIMLLLEKYKFLLWDFDHTFDCMKDALNRGKLVEAKNYFNAYTGRGFLHNIEGDQLIWAVEGLFDGDNGKLVKSTYTVENINGIIKDSKRVLDVPPMEVDF